MMKILRLQLFLIMMKATVVVILLFISGCTDIEEPECVSVWQSDRSQLTASAKIENAGIRLEVQNSAPSIAIEVFQLDLKGDFAITANFDAFSPGNGFGGFAQMIVSEIGDDSLGICGASIGNGMIDAFVGHPFDHPESRFTNFSSGTFGINRHDSTITSTCDVGNMMVSKTGLFSSEDLKISFQIGSNSEQLSGTTGITISGFTVLENAGVESDDFDCDKVL